MWRDFCDNSGSSIVVEMGKNEMEMKGRRKKWKERLKDCYME